MGLKQDRTTANMRTGKLARTSTSEREQRLAVADARAHDRDGHVSAAARGQRAGQLRVSHADGHGRAGLARHVHQQVATRVRHRRAEVAAVDCDQGSCAARAQTRGIGITTTTDSKKHN